MKKILSFIERHEIILVILCVVALLRLPGLFEPNRYADEDIYLTIGQGLRRGLLLYRDIFDNKTPLIYMVAAVAGNVMWFRFILMVWNLINVALIWGLAKKLIKNVWGVVLTTTLFAVFSSIPLLEGEIANGEIFMIMPVVAAVSLVLNQAGQLTERKVRYLAAGIFWAVAFLFKTPPLIELFGLIFFLVFYRTTSVKDFAKKIFDTRLWLLLVGFVVPVLVSLLYFFANGILSTYVTAVFLQNIGYLSSWGGGGSSLLSGGLVTRGIIMILALFLIWFSRKQLGGRFGLVAIWVATAIFGAFLSGRPYPHYLLEVVAPLALLLGLMMTKPSAMRLFVGGVIFGLLAVGVVRYQFWYYKSLPYYQNFVAYIFGAKTKDQYYQFWGDNILADYRASDYVNLVTDKNDKIFIWGTEPAIYAISNRQPAVKYTVAYHIVDFSAQSEVGQALMADKPSVILVVNSEKGRFSQLFGLLVSNYALTQTFGEIEIYQKLK